ncbi:hypothetical protein RhiirA4_252122 [Rhizophagus irregularis]|uniref:Uncharacterized protein n=1 Tax=Rhizophagus irregularis TaxID=588596 RepID=A0A2I1GTE1_9GLOM|nr:hypothetical protein RhiirA4_252122 [Rhizophagus irregularis]
MGNWEFREYGMTLRQALELEDHIKGLVSLFYRMRNGSRVMMQCLCDIETYINASTFLAEQKINFYLTPESNTIFCPR